MTSTRSRRRAVVALTAAAAALLTVSACGGGGGGSTAGTASPTFVFASGTDTPGVVPDGGGPAMPGMPSMPAPATTPASATSPGNVAAGPDAVSITNFAFAPASLTVPVGTTVTWTNKDEEPHTVSADDGSFRSQGLGTGSTFTFTFTKAGTFAYICTIHPFMHGTVVVTP